MVFFLSVVSFHSVRGQYPPVESWFACRRAAGQAAGWRYVGGQRSEVGGRRASRLGPPTSALRPPTSALRPGVARAQMAAAFVSGRLPVLPNAARPLAFLFYARSPPHGKGAGH